MPADPSIYSMIRPQERQPGPLDNFGSMLQLRALIDSGALNDLHRQKLQGDLDEESAFKSSLQGWVPGGELPAAAVRASPTRAAVLEKTRLDTEKTRVEIDKNKVETHGKQVQQLRDQLAAVSDDASLARLRDDSMKLYGPQAASGIPQSVAAPGFEEWRVGQLRTADKLLEYKQPKHEWRSDGQTERLFQTNPNAGKVGPVEGAPAITKQMTPGEADAARRAAESLTETKRHNLEVEGNAGTRLALDSTKEKPLTEHQGKATAFSMRMTDANKVIAELEAPASGFDPAALTSQMAGKTGLGAPLNYLAPKDAQRYEQAKRNWVTANLRLESGAAIPDPELAQEYRKWFPVPGDGEEVIKQKAGARKVAEQAMLVQSGPTTRTSAAEPAKPTAAKTFDAMPDPAQYVGKRIRADDGTIYKSNGKSWLREKA